MSGSDIEEQKQKKFVEGDAGDGTKRETHYLTGVRLVVCLISVLTCLFLCGLDQMIVAPALTVIGNEFDAMDSIGWVTSGFFLPGAVLTVAWGKFGLVIGRKYCMLLAIFIFAMGSLMCALAPNMDVLIGGRVLAGVGGGGVQNSAFIIINEVTPINKRPLAFSSLSAVFTLASIAGPLVGGAFTSHVSWRWCFYINLPIAGIAAVFIFAVFNPPMPTGKLSDRLKTIDYFGSFLLAAGLVLFLLGLSFGAENEYPWRSAAVILNIILGVLFLIGFGVWNFCFSKIPIIPVVLMKSVSVIAAVVGFSSTFSVLMSLIMYLAVYFENVVGKSPIQTGIHLLPAMLPTAFLAMVSGVVVNKTRYVKPFVIMGAVFGMVGAGLYCLLDVDSSNANRVGLLILGSVGQGILMQSMNMAGQLAAPPFPMGTVMTATLLVFGRALGGSLSTLLSEVIYNTCLRSQTAKALAALTNESVSEKLSNYDLSILVSNTDLLNQLSAPTKRFVREQIVFAVRRVFYFILGLAALCLISALFVTNRRVPQAHETTQNIADRVQEEVTKSEKDNEGEAGQESAESVADPEEDSASKVLRA